MTSTLIPKVALSKDFLESYSRLPRKVQKKVREFTEKFRKDPTQSGINFETLEFSKDDKIRSVRVGLDYRLILIHPPKGDVYLCVWVDHHDEAYQWAKNRVFEVNPHMGAFQVYDMEGLEQAELPIETEAIEETPGLLAEVDSEELLLAGVPSPLLPAVRALHTDDEVEKLAPHLPEEAAEMLYLLAAGYDFMAALEEISATPPTPAAAVDVEDFQAALERPETQRTFKVVADDADLADVLDAPLDQWRIFLHPSQRKLVTWNVKWPIRVLGGAGTGKTVALLHRARHLARDVFTEPDDRVLVTTFTKNLAGDLRTNLRNLCGPEFERIEVVNIHSWAVQFMRKQGQKFVVLKTNERNDRLERAWGSVDDPQFPLSFYQDEWEQVVQAAEVLTREEYFKVRRVGRGTRISRQQRAKIWEVFEAFRRILEDEHRVEWSDVVRETRMYIEKQKIQLPYKAVLVDEVQDMKPGELKLFRSIVPSGPNDMFLVGDGHQRIYGRPCSLSACGIEIRGRSRRLKLNYRTTQRIRNYAVALLKGLEIDDLDDGIDNLKGYTSLRTGVDPEVHHFAKEGQEAKFIVERVKKWLETNSPNSICLTARTKKDLNIRYAALLKREGIPFRSLEGDDEDSSSEPEKVRISTMHRMKGLEFPRVMIVGMHSKSMPLEVEGITDDAGREDHELREKCLFYVAATRARDELVVTGYGEKSAFL